MVAERQSGPSSLSRQSSRLERPLLVYDGDCGFCLRWIERWRGLTGERVGFAPYQRVGPDYPQVTTEQFAESVWLFEPDGRSSSGAEAVFRGLSQAPGWRWPLLLYRWLPGARWLSEIGYRFVAEHRQGLSRLDGWLVGRHVVRSEWLRSRRLFLAGLGLVALLAFLSLWVQVDGLMGSHGIAPVEHTLQSVREFFGDGAATSFPTLLWLAPGDALLHGLCAGGVLLSLLMLLGVAPALCAAGLWAAYLSLTVAGGEFLSFQWDSLLIETCLLAVWYAPWRLWRGRAAEPAPSALARWLLWWLLFRFMFESGVVKLTAGDAAWPELTAMTWHYWTQPLPHALSWWAHHMPLWLHKASVLGMFATELAAPFLILAPRRLRHLGAVVMIGLQVMIGVTGNYGFFNLLTIVLCLALLDDQVLDTLGRRLRRMFRREDGDPLELPPLVVSGRVPRAQRVGLGVFAVIVLLLSGMQVHDLFGERMRVSTGQVQAGIVSTLLHDGIEPALRVAETRAAPFLSVNSYGLFRVMTKRRPEIVVQGSADGETWIDYDFRWKPDPLDKTLRWVQPHMPRLDWRLWFEALNWQPSALQRQPFRTSGWFAGFLGRLREGEPAVLDLLASNPFPDQPPVAVRATLYWYEFTDPTERAETGEVWKRQRIMLNWIILSRPDG